MGRPKATAATKKTEAVNIRMTPSERAVFDRLKASRVAELKGEGVEVTDAGLVRWLVAKEAAARGLDKATARRG
jgi:hypothetical protein